MKNYIKSMLIFSIGIALGGFSIYFSLGLSKVQEQEDIKNRVVFNNGTYKVVIKKELYYEQHIFAAICRGREYVEVLFKQDKINQDQYKRASAEIEKKIMKCVELIHNINDDKSKEVAINSIKLFLRETDKLVVLLEETPDLYVTEDEW